MAHDKDRVRIAAILPGVVVGPSDRLCQVFRYLLHGHVRNKTVVGRDEHEAPVQERPWLGRHVRLVAALPPTAVDPEYDRLVLAFSRGVNIEHPRLLFRLEVGEVTVDPRFCGENDRRQHKDGKAYNKTHNVSFTLYAANFAALQRQCLPAGLSLMGISFPTEEAVGIHRTPPANPVETVQPALLFVP